MSDAPPPENPYGRGPDGPGQPGQPAYEQPGQPGQPAYEQPGPTPYGAPPASPYGAPPATGPYGSPPPAYGAPQPGGYPPPAGYGYQSAPPNDGLGVAAMIVGIASIVLACGYGIGLIGSPVALVLGLRSKRRIDRSQGQLGGRGMAQAGFVLGIIGTVLLVIAIALVVVVVIAIASSPDFRQGFEDGMQGDLVRLLA